MLNPTPKKSLCRIVSLKHAPRDGCRYASPDTKKLTPIPEAARVAYVCEPSSQTRCGDVRRMPHANRFSREDRAAFVVRRRIIAQILNHPGVYEQDTHSSLSCSELSYHRDVCLKVGRCGFDPASQRCFPEAFAYRAATESCVYLKRDVIENMLWDLIHTHLQRTMTRVALQRLRTALFQQWTQDPHFRHFACAGLHHAVFKAYQASPWSVARRWVRWLGFGEHGPTDDTPLPSWSQITLRLNKITHETLSPAAWASRLPAWYIMSQHLPTLG